MKICIIFLLSISFIGLSVSEIARHNLFLKEEVATNPDLPDNQIEMKYHGTPSYYWTL